MLHIEATVRLCPCEHDVSIDLMLCLSYALGKMADHARPAIERCIREKGLRLGRGTSKCSPDEMQQGAACDPSGLRCALPPERHVHQMTMRQFWNETARYNHSNDSGGRNDTGLRFLYGTHKIEDNFESDLIRRDLRGLRSAASTLHCMRLLPLPLWTSNSAARTDACGLVGHGLYLRTHRPRTSDITSGLVIR